jgi:hypothetical protein
MGTPKELMPNAQDLQSFKIYAKLVYDSGKYPVWIKESNVFNSEIQKKIKIENSEEQQVAMIMMVLLAGWELNLHPLQALAKINFATSGKLQVEGELFLALLKREYPNHYIKIDATRIGCKIEAKCNKDDPNEAMYIREFTTDDAKLAGLLAPKGTTQSLYVTYPRHMLKWAAIREMKAEKFPDVLFGATLDSTPVMLQMEEETQQLPAKIIPKIMIQNETIAQIPDATISEKSIEPKPIAESAMPKMPEFTLKIPEPVKESPKSPEPLKMEQPVIPASIEPPKIEEKKKVTIIDGITDTTTGKDFVVVPQKVEPEPVKQATPAMGLPEMKPIPAKKSTSMKQALEIPKSAQPALDLSFLENLTAVVKADAPKLPSINAFFPNNKKEELPSVVITSESPKAPEPVKTEQPAGVIAIPANPSEDKKESFGIENLACKAEQITPNQKFWFSDDWFATTRDKREGTGSYPVVLYLRILDEAFPRAQNQQVHEQITAFAKKFLDKKDKNETVMNVYHDAAMSAISMCAKDYADVDLKFMMQMEVLIVKLLQNVKPLLEMPDLTDEALCVKILEKMNWTRPKYANWAYSFLKKRGYLKESVRLDNGKQIIIVQKGIESINV